MDNKTTDANIIREYFEALSTPQIEKQIEDLKTERTEYMTKSNDYRVLADGVNQKIEIGVAVIGEKNYKNALNSFKPTTDHIVLLNEFGTDPAFLGASDYDIAQLLNWEYTAEGLTTADAERLARLGSELKLAQSYVNRLMLEKYGGR